jgi:hypothetical protein
LKDPTSVAVIRYSGDSSALTIRSEWQNMGDDHPVMVNAAPSY